MSLSDTTTGVRSELVPSCPTAVFQQMCYKWCPVQGQNALLMPSSILKRVILQALYSDVVHRVRSVTVMPATFSAEATMCIACPGVVFVSVQTGHEVVTYSSL